MGGSSLLLLLLLLLFSVADIAPRSKTDKRTWMFSETVLFRAELLFLSVEDAIWSIRLLLCP